MDLMTVVLGAMAATIVALVFIVFRVARAGDAKAQAAAVRAKQGVAIQAIERFMSLPRRERRKIMAEINKRNVARNTREQEQEILDRHGEPAEDEGPDLEVVSS